MRIGAFLLVAVVAVLALLAAACGGGGEEPTTSSALPDHLQREVEDARRFDDYPVYWVGESFQGLPLTTVSRMDYPGKWPGEVYNLPWHEVAFAYGDCEIGPGEESCAVPVSVHVRPYCEVPQEVVAEGAKAGSPEVVRGAVVQRLSGGSLQLWTGDITISIAATDEGLLTPAVQNLVRLNGDGEPSSPQEDLGPPDEIDAQTDCGWERVPGGPGWQRSETAD